MNRAYNPENNYTLQVFYYRDIIVIDDNPILRQWLDSSSIAAIASNPDTTGYLVYFYCRLTQKYYPA